MPTFAHLALVTLFSCAHGRTRCKTTPSDTTWPSYQDWQALNVTINGTLIATAPAASACYSSNPFGSDIPCSVTEDGWKTTDFHAERPESVDFPLFANYTCTPPNQTGYINGSACTIGAFPVYVVNSTRGHDVATAMGWAAKRNLRIVVKGTGHDYNGRSVGAHSLSIWTHYLTDIQFVTWQGSEDAVIIGSGWRYGDAYDVVYKHDYTLAGGGDSSVGLGGHIQGGGHGPYSSHYGLAADQIFQVTVATTEGKLLVANATQNQDLLFAIRGGGGGQYGVVTEYVLKLYPRPRNTMTGELSMYCTSESPESNKTWTALAATMSELPFLMDEGIAGSLVAAEGASAMAWIPALSSPPPGVAFIAQLIAYNTSTTMMNAQMDTFISRIMKLYGGNPDITFVWNGAKLSNTSFPSSVPGSLGSIAGGGSVMSSRLLGRAELSLPVDTLEAYLHKIMYSPTDTGLLIVGLQGGKGVMNVPEHMRGAVNPVWRSTYLHVMSYTTPIDTILSPKKALAKAGDWAEIHLEEVWRKWAPNTGAYMNEANPFNTHWKQDFYGVHYDTLVDIKRKYDPSESLYVSTGVGTDEWDYDLDTGRLCRVC